MAVGILIITHERVGQALLDTACETLGFCPMDTKVVSVPRNLDPEQMQQQALTDLRHLDQGDGVLILTDMYGSTPSNIACRLVDSPQIEAVAGLSLPMLIRVLNYPRLGLKELKDKAVSGAREGIVECDNKPTP